MNRSRVSLLNRLNDEDVNFISDVDQFDIPVIKLKAYGLYKRSKSRPATALSEWEDIGKPQLTVEERLGPYRTLPLTDRERMLKKFALEDKLAERNFKKTAIRRKTGEGKKAAQSNKPGKRLDSVANDQITERRRESREQWYANYVAGLRHSKNYWEFVGRLQDVEPRISFGAKRRSTLKNKRRYIFNGVVVTLDEDRPKSKQLSELSYRETVDMEEVARNRIEEVCQYLENKRLWHRGKVREAILKKSRESWARRQRFERLHVSRKQAEEERLKQRLEEFHQRLKSLHSPSQYKLQVPSGLARPAKALRHADSCSGEQNGSRIRTRKPAGRVSLSQRQKSKVFVRLPLRGRRSVDAAGKPEESVNATDRQSSTDDADILRMQRHSKHVKNLDKLFSKNVFSVVGGYREVTNAFLAAHPKTESDQQADGAQSASSIGGAQIEFDLPILIRQYHTPKRILLRKSHVNALKARSTKLAQETIYASSEPAKDSVRQSECRAAVEPKVELRAEGHSRPNESDGSNIKEFAKAQPPGHYVVLPIKFIKPAPTCQPNPPMEATAPLILPEAIPLNLDEVIERESVRVITPTYRPSKKGWVPFQTD